MNKCYFVLVEEGRVTVRVQKTKEKKKNKHKTLMQSLKVEGHACV